jgi:glycosyltransferase involved in cell wall biosynthesis
MHYCGAQAQQLVKQGEIVHTGIRSPYYRLLYRMALPTERRVVTSPYLRQLIMVSRGLESDFHRHYPITKPTIVIPNGIDTARFAQVEDFRNQMRHELDLAQNDLVGCICSQGDWKRKGLDLLIDAVAGMANKATKILVVGGGPIEHYKQSCAEKQVSDQFIFTGMRKDLPRIYAACDYFILPTAYEAWPLVALEAAASGLPIVGTPVNGLVDLINDGVTGRIIERDTGKIRDVLQGIIAQPDSLPAMGRAAQNGDAG